VSCSNSIDNNNSKENSEDKIVEKPLPKKIFDKNKDGQYITENEIRKSIKLYLDKNEELSEASEYYEDKIDSEESLSQNEIKKLKKLNNLNQKNDENFKSYIKRPNKLPKSYRKDTERISKYISHSNKYSQNLEKKIDKIIDKGINQKKVSIKDIGKIENDSTIVNGREQSKIEKFLNEKNIKTKAFKK
jgi:hypothetical protein